MGGGIVATVTGAASAASLQLQALDPAVAAGAPGAVRAAVSFLLTILLGGFVIYRYGDRVDAAVDASMSNPVASTVYGLGAFVFVVFVVAFGLSELSRAGVGLRLVSTVVLVAFAAMVLLLGAVGFGVVGVWLAGVLGARDPLVGLAAVAGASAVAWLVLPFVLGALVWLAIAAVGVGGPTRQWVHASAVEPEGERTGQD